MDDPRKITVRQVVQWLGCASVAMLAIAMIGIVGTRLAVFVPTWRQYEPKLNACKVFGTLGGTLFGLAAYGTLILSDKLEASRTGTARFLESQDPQHEKRRRRYVTIEKSLRWLMLLAFIVVAGILLGGQFWSKAGSWAVVALVLAANSWMVFRHFWVWPLDQKLRDEAEKERSKREKN